MNLARIIRDHAGAHAEKTAIRFRSQQISYAELWRMVETIAGHLAARGVGRGDRVGLSMSEHPTHLAAHYAVARIGAVIVPIDHRWTESEKRSAVDAFDVRTVLTDADELSADAGAALPGIDDTDRDLLISLSSGTTGKPKGALVTHGNLYERFVSQWKAIGYGERDCFAVLTPFYFGAGRSFGMSLLAAGGTVLIAAPPMKPPEIVTVLQQPFVTATFLPPTLMRRLFALCEAGTGPLFPNIRFLIASGEPLFAEEAHEAIEKLTPNLFSYYASSEGGGISVLRAGDFAEFAATVGKPTYRTEVEIVDENGNELGSGAIGRLRYRGPGVATRYIDADGNERETAVGGWFYPGDLAERLESGHIALRGRDKDVVIRGGVNIYPAEIEATLLTHANIDEVAVLGIDDPARGQVLRAFYAGDVTDEELTAWCRERLAPYKIPQDFVAMEELPRRSSGKIDKRSLLS